MSVRDHQPNFVERAQLPIDESTRPLGRIDYLIKLMGKDKAKFGIYRKVLVDPDSAVQTQYSRYQTAEVLEILLDLIFKDEMLWNRVKTLLLRKNSSLGNLKSRLSESAMKMLIEKSFEYEVPLETLFEVYSRGTAMTNDKLTKEQLGFNRVNSYLNGGAAYQLDADLHETTTPKQPVKDRTLAEIKSILRKK